MTSKRALTSFSESPRHLLTRVEAEMLKKVVLHSDATAFASSVFPVPGGPCKRMPFQGLSDGERYWGREREKERERKGEGEGGREKMGEGERKGRERERGRKKGRERERKNRKRKEKKRVES